MKMDCRYYDKFDNLLVCDCPAKSELKSNVKWDGECPTFGKFGSMSPNEKQKVLKERSKEHYKKENSKNKDGIII